MLLQYRCGKFLHIHFSIPFHKNSNNSLWKIISNIKSLFSKWLKTTGKFTPKTVWYSLNLILLSGCLWELPLHSVQQGWSLLTQISCSRLMANDGCMAKQMLDERLWRILFRVYLFVYSFIYTFAWRLGVLDYYLSFLFLKPGSLWFLLRDGQPMFGPCT